MNNLSMLYAEDDVDVLQDTLFLLGTYFTSVCSAQDGESALELYYKNRPDIILLDINLPFMSGLEVARKIRETDDETPIVMITAYSDKDKLLNAIDLGVSAYIIKPFKIAEIKKTIEKLIEKKSNKNEIILDAEFRWNLELEKLYYKRELISLTKKEILLMNLLCNNPKKFFTPQEVAREMFPDSDRDVDSNSATQLISRFKKKILKDLDIDRFFIENVYGVGYRIK